jgi:hypothetical protein
MAWHILRIEPCENDTLPEAQTLPIVETISVRGRQQDMPIPTVVRVLAEHGYELGPVVGATATKQDWPLTAYIYTSANRKGIGRFASTLRRWPVRKQEKN